MMTELEKFEESRKTSEILGRYLEWRRMATDMISELNDYKGRYFLATTGAEVRYMRDDMMEFFEDKHKKTINDFEKWLHENCREFDSGSIENVLMRYYGIDSKKLEDERRELLDNFRSEG